MTAQLTRDEIEQLAARYDVLVAEIELLKLASETVEGPPLGEGYRRLCIELTAIAVRLHYAHSGQLLPSRL